MPSSPDAGGIMDKLEGRRILKRIQGLTNNRGALDAEAMLVEVQAAVAQELAKLGNAQEEVEPERAEKKGRNRMRKSADWDRQDG